ncbi:thiol-disulfide isomerase/thioredoxin [Palleronia aestuarii]|uniref:Thiol-disulfide isomerase/thioredoxin n=1 Tax=Palleronia aestuarii TaxID=568105 RepID=A0A2W7N7C7_9RHOB|nr:TlpA disulfide reductase family protein [Palleronia aestuarii]PZX12784.1 thiol-disulfide isomerase/thioredoxin [Palleronia aestuarii]
MNAVQIGPLLFDGARFTAIIAALAFAVTAGIVSWWYARRGMETRVPVFALIVVWIVAARVGFVAINWETFAAHPLEAFALWQGGFSARAGTIGFAVVALAAILSRPGTVAPILIGAGVAVLAANATEFALRDGSAATLPGTAFSAYEGAPVTLSDRNGTPLVVNLWATWCPPCRREMPMMLEVAGQAEGIDVVFANQGETPPQIASFLDETGLDGDGIVFDPDGQLLGGLGAMGLPTTLFFDAQGSLVSAHTGEISRAAFTSAIEDLGGKVR